MALSRSSSLLSWLDLAVLFQLEFVNDPVLLLPMTQQRL